METYNMIYDWTPLISEDGARYPVYMPEVRKQYSNTSFPNPIRDYILEPFGYLPVIDTDQPIGDVITEGAPRFNEEDGKWYKTWEVRDFTEEEVAQNLQNLKQTTNERARFVYDEDRQRGIVVTVGEESKALEISASNMAILHNIDFMFSIDENDIQRVKFQDESLVSLTKPQFDQLFLDFNRKYSDLRESYYDFVESVTQSADKDSVPEVPETFVK